MLNGYSHLRKKDCTSLRCGREEQRGGGACLGLSVHFHGGPSTAELLYLTVLGTPTKVNGEVTHDRPPLCASQPQQKDVQSHFLRWEYLFND